MNPFQTPRESLGDLDAELAANILTAASDISLVVDNKGIICDLACGGSDLCRDDCHSWLGQPWLDTVTIESRPKVEALLRDATAQIKSRGRQVNHPIEQGADLPVLYSAVSLDRNGRVIAVGRDLRALASLQQRLVEVQQSIERDYLRFRNVEMRYRLLFQMASEGILIVDAATRKIVEANPAASQLLNTTVRRLQGQQLSQVLLKDLVNDTVKKSLQTLLERVRATGNPGQARLRFSDKRQDLLLSASLFRQDNSSLFLLRLSSAVSESAALINPNTSRVLQIVANSPDGFLVTDLQGVILMANRAFLDLAQLATEEQAKGQSLERWLGRAGIDLNVLLSNLREHGSLRLFATTVRGEYDSTSEIEISAVSVASADPPCLGFSIRNIGQRFDRTFTGRELPRSVEQLTGLVGRMPLKDLVRDTTNMVERLCIEAALELTHDNRASAAEMLGLSRQSLYVKLRRYGLGDLASDNES